MWDDGRWAKLLHFARKMRFGDPDGVVAEPVGGDDFGEEVLEYLAIRPRRWGIVDSAQGMKNVKLHRPYKSRVVMSANMPFPAPVVGYIDGAFAYMAQSARKVYRWSSLRGAPCSVI